MPTDNRRKKYLFPKESIRDNIAFQEAMGQQDEAVLALAARSEKIDGRETYEVFEAARHSAWEAVVNVVDAHVAAAVAAVIESRATAFQQPAPARTDSTSPADVPASAEYKATFRLSEWLKKTLDDSPFDDLLSEYETAAGLIHMQPDDHTEAAKPPHHEALLALFHSYHEAVYASVIAFGAKCFAEGQHPDYHMTRPPITGQN